MSISKRALDTIHAQLQAQTKGATYIELSKLTGYAIPTVKLAISNLSHSGAVVATHSKPVSFRAIEMPPRAGQTLVIKEPVPPIELDSRMIAQIIAQSESSKPLADEMLVVLFDRLKSNTHEKNHALLVFLVNFTEVIRQRLENGKELSIDDFEGTN